MILLTCVPIRRLSGKSENHPVRKQPSNKQVNHEVRSPLRAASRDASARFKQVAKCAPLMHTPGKCGETLQMCALTKHARCCRLPGFILRCLSNCRHLAVALVAGAAAPLTVARSAERLAGCRPVPQPSGFWSAIFIPSSMPRATSCKSYRTSFSDAEVSPGWYGLWLFKS